MNKLKLLSKNLITKSISPPLNVAILESVNSTNDFLKAAENTAVDVCIAEHQTLGRGRFNREWYSPYGQNIYFSCRYPFQLPVSNLSGLSLITSLAVLKILKQYSANLFVKWPNDIVHESGKISGILIETQIKSNGLCDVIIGIGINVNMDQAQNSINQNWTSLKILTNCIVDRNKLCIGLINELWIYYRRFNENTINDFLSEWVNVDYLFQKQINLRIGKFIVQGVVLGIDSSGNLLLKSLDGKIQSFSSGEASIVK